MNTPTLVKDLVARFNLLPHPEGGYYRENYRAIETIPRIALPKRYKGDRHYSTAIYFLLEQGNYSAFHRIQSDECWHFYAGDCLLIHVIHLNGRLETIRLGADFNQGEVFQAVVPAGVWFASEPATGSEYALVGCTVAPGFDFSEFELADREQLSKQYPQHHTLIQCLCRQVKG
ncbi:MAG: cupin domain-containing protein [Ferruginibacter sp.]|nr:cupin domain-containing protein [Ferruginibacter sp.]